MVPDIIEIIKLFFFFGRIQWIEDMKAEIMLNGELQSVGKTEIMSRQLKCHEMPR